MDETPTPVTNDDPLLPLPGERFQGQAIGLDIGGTGIKGALVDVGTGKLLTERIREKTPHPATPDAVLEVALRIIRRLAETGPIEPATPCGAGVPGVVKFGRLMSAANIDKAWLTIGAEERFRERLERPVLLLNDADAAGLGEVSYGAASGRSGTIVLLTVGTGIGSALFIDGRLVPNTELGHLELHGRDAETRVSGAARERRGLGWKPWAREFNEYLGLVEAYLWPDLIILGGGVSKEMAKFERHLETRAPVIPAALLNSAGIAGAALAAINAQQAGRSAAPEASGATGTPDS